MIYRGQHAPRNMLNIIDEAQYTPVPSNKEGQKIHAQITSLNCMNCITNPIKIRHRINVSNRPTTINPIVLRKREPATKREKVHGNVVASIMLLMDLAEGEQYFVGYRKWGQIKREERLYLLFPFLFWVFSDKFTGRERQESDEERKQRMRVWRDRANFLFYSLLLNFFPFSLPDGKIRGSEGNKWKVGIHLPTVKEISWTLPLFIS